MESILEFLETRTDVADVVTAIISLVVATLAFFLSLYQLNRSYRAHRKEQATQINAWWVRVDDDICGHKEIPSQSPSVEYTKPPIKDRNKYYAGIALLNESKIPIVNMLVHGSAYKMEKGERTEDLLATDLFQPILVSGEYISLAIGDYDKKRERPWTYPEEASVVKERIGKVRPIINDAKWKVKFIVFEDAAGRVWTRKGNGKLASCWFFVKTYLSLKSSLIDSGQDQPKEPDPNSSVSIFSFYYQFKKSYEASIETEQKESNESSVYLKD